MLAAAVAVGGLNLNMAGAANPSAGGLPLAFLDPDETSWLSVRNLTDAAFSAYFAERSAQGYMVIDIEVAEINGEQRVGATWQKNSDGRGWVEKRNLTSAQFHAEWTALKEKGFRLIDQDAYTLGSTQYYAGVWIENKEDLGWLSYRDVDSATFGDNFDKYKPNFMMVDVESYVLDGQRRYAAVWVANPQNIAWAERRDLTSQQFADEFQQYSDDGFRILDFESYLRGGAQNYAAIWVKNTNGRGWYEYRDMSAKQFGDRWIELRDAGFRLVDYEVYDFAGGGVRYAGVWRQNGARADWALKARVDARIQAEVDQFDVPGMSVAIAKDGKLVYLRGFGHADIDDNVIAHSRTIYRLASVSKAVGGVLAMRMSQLNQIDLDNSSSDYIPGLPAFHTHSVKQTVTNRSGIGHYSTAGIVDSYPTALAATQQLSGTLLSGPIGSYLYSTDAYSYLGASLENAGGQSIGALLKSRISDPFGLPTLRKENRAIDKSLRASIYNVQNEEADPDDISWKVLGGGLEASAYDLARFGIKTMNGDILNAASRALVWAPGAPGSNYAMGWNIGEEQGVQVVAKTGAQAGARSYIRMYPSENIVIVVLSNRRYGGHSAAQVGKDIGALMLGHYLPAVGAARAQQIVPVGGLQPVEPSLDPDGEQLPASDVPLVIVANPKPLSRSELAPDTDESSVSAERRVLLPLVGR
jgi:CubicO group peptidase (beta-lactamase class C family)